MLKLKKILQVILILTLVALLVRPQEKVEAADGVVYFLGMQLKEGEIVASNSTDIITFKPGTEGYAMLSGTTLTLVNYEYTGDAAYESANENFLIYSTGSLTINVVGSCNITTTLAKSYGVYADGSLSISSDDSGSLTLNDFDSCGILSGSSLTLTDVTINVNSDKIFEGLNIAGKYISTNSTYNAKVGGVGMVYKTSSTISAGSTINISNPDNGLVTVGIESSYGSLTVDGGTVNAHGSVSAIRTRNVIVNSGEVVLSSHHDTKSNWAIEKGQYEYKENVKLIVSKETSGSLAEYEDPSKYTEYKYMRFTTSNDLYTVTFDGNGLTGQMKNLYTTGSFVLPDSKFSLGTYDEFLGWRIGEQLHQPGEIINLEGDLAAKAEWLLHECTDDAKDHICDVCGLDVGTHEASPGGHTCSYCNLVVTECIDEDKNHLCDVCDAKISEHEESETSHNCGYCNEIISECLDNDRNHECDVCGLDVGTHEASPGGHTCAYCNLAVTECIDENRNHLCDVCEAKISEHEESNTSHNCGYCNEIISECLDNDRNHECDVCGLNVGIHEAYPGGHVCSYCNLAVTECIDEDRNHLCDVCDEKISEHEESDTSHYCGYCNEIISQCIDDDKNHVCDICEFTISGHTPEEKSHICSYCKETISECLDDDKNHACDICDAKMGDHAASEGTHICLYCEEVVTECVDDDKNHKCDICEKEMGEHVASDKSHNCGYCSGVITECIDDDKNHKCDVCEKEMGEHAASDKSHNCGYCNGVITECTDSNKDGKCDVCDKALSNPKPPVVDDKKEEDTFDCSSFLSVYLVPFVMSLGLLYIVFKRK